MRIGPIEFPAPFCQAGLAGYSDRAMRVVARRRGCPYAVTEALLDVILANGGGGVGCRIDGEDEEHPGARRKIRGEAPTEAHAPPPPARPRDDGSDPELPGRRADHRERAPDDGARRPTPGRPRV